MAKVKAHVLATQRVARGAACALALAGFPHIAAADWESIPAVRLGVDGNDNPRLGQWVPGPGEQSAPEEHTATRTFLDARLELVNTGTRGSFTIEPRVTLDTYQDEADDDLEREDAFLTMRGLYRGLRTETRIDASVSRESILTSELEGTDFTDVNGGLRDAPIPTDTGVLVLLDEHQEQVTLSPSVEIRLSDRAGFSVEASHMDVAYTGPQFFGRSDFTDTGLSLGYNRALSNRGRASIRLLASKFSTDLTDNDTDTVGIEGAYAIELSALWSIDAYLGLEKSTFDFLSGSGPMRVTGEDSNVTFGVGANLLTSRGTFIFDLGRSVGPNGSGFLSTRNDMRGFYRRQLAQQVRMGLGFTLSETEALDAQFDSRDYARIDFDIEWALTAKWGLSFGLSAIDQEFSADLTGGRANVFSFGAVYRGLRRPPPIGPR